MKEMITAHQCLEVIAELAVLLPPLLAKGRLFPGLDDDDLADRPLRREPWDPVFTGGGIVSLLITDPAAPPASLTKDVDLVLEIGHWMEFASLEDVLRQAGFRQKTETGLIVAWEWRGVRIDFLPHKPIPQMEMTNRWFPYLLEDARYVEVMAGQFAWLASAPCFLATKLEAFYSRGKDDYLGSKDIEDILAVIDGRPELADELALADATVRGFLGQCFRGLLHDSRFLDALAYLLGDNDREGIALERLARLQS